MPTIKFSSHSLEITADTEEQVRALYEKAITTRAVPAPAESVTEIKRHIEDASGLEFVERPPPDNALARADALQISPEPARRAPQVENDPDVRDRQRQAAANAREALAKKRAQQAAEAVREEAAAAAQTEQEPAAAPRRRGRAAAPRNVADLSGDREDGDTAHSPDTEPADPHAAAAPSAGAGNGATPVLSIEQQRQTCLEGLQDVAALGDSGAIAVKQAVRDFGVKKIRDVPEDRMTEFWAKTAELCATFNVPFPPPPTAVH